MKNNIHYECMMGSVAYGVSDDTSDIDMYGFCIPPRHIIFPYHHGALYDFDNPKETFHQFQEHHIKTPKGEYDVNIYNIVRFLRLCAENNPNMIDALFVPTRCVLHSTAVGNYIRDNRKKFLSKRCYHKFKGYAFSQLHKMKNKFAKEFVDHCKKYNIPLDASLKDILAPLSGDEKAVSHMMTVVNKIETNGKRSKRLPMIAEHGYDTKFAYHVVRLLDECQMILEECDLDITRSREHLKAIRRGEWSMDKVIMYFDLKLPLMEELEAKSKLPYAVNMETIKEIILNALEMHYGTLASMVGGEKNVDRAVRKIAEGLSRIESGLDILYEM
jgi:hypothetical protein